MVEGHEVSLAGWTAGFHTATLFQVVEPKLPKEVSPFARSCRDALAADGLGRHLSIGGAFGLAHYHEYRPTNDVDAWWRQPVSREDRDAIVAVLTRALESFGIVRTRAGGDVASVELEQGGKTVFSFKIAQRSAQIDATIEGMWPDCATQRGAGSCGKRGRGRHDRMRMALGREAPSLPIFPGSPWLVR